MPTIIVGIDEAGYGPMLGPLCVGATAFRLNDPTTDEFDHPELDLWRRLKGAVCRSGNDKRRRVGVDDSKKLKLSNSGKVDPLIHLERGVLTFLRTINQDLPATDDALLARLGIHRSPDDPGRAWYGGTSNAIPNALTPGEIAIASNQVMRELMRAQITPLLMTCEAMFERDFNDVVEREASKAAATEALIGRLLRRAIALEPDSTDPILIVCDRQGGRVRYAERLAGQLEMSVETIGESAERCRYRLGCARRVELLFAPEADADHLPVALASMTAKLCRELLMRRFNRYWEAKLPGLKPTAGYTTDARRWLVDAAEVLAGVDRDSLVRRR